MIFSIVQWWHARNTQSHLPCLIRSCWGAASTETTEEPPINLFLETLASCVCWWYTVALKGLLRIGVETLLSFGVCVGFYLVKPHVAAG